MSTGGLLLVGVVIAIGLVGIVLPVLPGAVLVLAAIIFWAYDVGSTTSWVTAVIAFVIIAAAQVAKYVVPGRRLSAGGVPTTAQV